MAEVRSPQHRAFGQALRTVRQQRGLSQQQLAELAGLDRTYLGAIERGERNPSLANLFKLAQSLQVRLQDVAGAAELIAAGAELLTRGPGPEARHPISSGLEQAALALKKLAVEPTPISVRAVEDIRHDAARVLAELLEVLYHLERVTGESTGVIPALATALEALEPSN